MCHSNRNRAVCGRRRARRQRRPGLIRTLITLIIEKQQEKRAIMEKSGEEQVYGTVEVERRSSREWEVDEKSMRGGSRDQARENAVAPPIGPPPTYHQAIKAV